MSNKALIVSLVTVLIGGVILELFFPKKTNMIVKEFELAEYQSYVDEYQLYIVENQLDITADKIYDATTAKIQAEKVWISYFGEEVLDEKPYHVSYDYSSKVWLVSGSLPIFSIGGVAEILIRSDGEILAIWHGK